MSEAQSNGTKPKKMVSRNVAVALGIICILLIAGIGSVWFFYLVGGIQKDEDISRLNSQIAYLNEQILEQNSTISQQNSQIAQLNLQISSLQNQTTLLSNAILSLNSSLTDLQAIVDLQKSTILFDNTVYAYAEVDGFVYQPSSGYLIYNNLPYSSYLAFALDANPPYQPTNYAGYVCINVTGSTSNSTYIEWNYTTSRLTIDNKVTAGTIGLFCFPILPTQTLCIAIGNPDLSIINVQRVIITYYY